MKYSIPKCYWAQKIVSVFPKKKYQLLRENICKFEGVLSLKSVTVPKLCPKVTS